MRLQTAFLSRQEVETVHRNALRVLEEVGVKVEHEAIRRRLGTVGGIPDEAADVVRFPARAAEQHIAEAPKNRMTDGPARVSARVGIYGSRLLCPGSDELVGFDEARLAGYAGWSRCTGAAGSGRAIIALHTARHGRAIPRSCPAFVSLIPPMHT